MKIVVADINGAAAKTLADELGPATAPFEFDYRNADSIKDLIDFAVDTFGKLDLLHNNAVSASNDGPIEFADVEAWDAAYEVTIRGYMLACKHAIPHLRANGGGRIVNMGSDSALAGDLQLTAYGSTKAAVLTMTKYLATQVGKDNILCVSVTPGVMFHEGLRAGMPEPIQEMFLEHHLTPRLGRPADLAGIIAFLASSDADFITGINIPVDGGFYSHLPTTADFRRMAAQA